MSDSDEHFRVIYGHKVRCHPEADPVRYPTERVRWSCMHAGLLKVLGSVPGEDRRLYAALAQCRAYCLSRMHGEKPGENQELLFDPDVE